MSLETYHRKRDFRRTPEPTGGEADAAGYEGVYVIQKHAASRLHYDLRLELRGVLVSWAVPKGPSLDVEQKRLAVHVEDHPLEYGSFEGVIPEGEYGGGAVLLWDRGQWIPEADPGHGLRKGHLVFRLAGEKLRGGWHLVRLKADGDDRDNWLLMKREDEFARSSEDGDILEEQPESVASGRLIDQVAADGDRVWHSNREAGIELDPGGLSEAREDDLPDWIAPQLATRVKRPPEGGEWLHEIKFDGYRALCRLDSGEARLLTRKGLDWTHRFGPVASAAAHLPARSALVDGEVVVLKPDGTTSFGALQEALSAGGEGLVYYAFDLLHLDGWDLTAAPLEERKELLARLLGTAGPGSGIRYSDHVQGHGGSFFEQACGRGLEGIVSKRAGAPYRPGRGRDWVKIKCLQQQEFVIGGFTEPSGSRVGFGALLLGFYENGGFEYAGRVGTGFDDAALRTMHARLLELERADSPFRSPLPRREARGAHWVEPLLVAAIEFTEWTRDNRLRHPVFQGLREDVEAMDVVRERAVEPPGEAGKEPAMNSGKDRKRAKGETAVAGVRLTHPDRVVYPDEGITKLDLALLYETIGDRILPHIARRPLTLVRCPRGQTGECFYQKHADEAFPDSVLRVEMPEPDGEPAEYIAVDSLAGLIALVQFGALEFHVWGSRMDDLERPDRLVFDLDPDPKLPWARVIAAARSLRSRLEELGLPAFAKTTGGKGFHVEVPILAEHGWETVKMFSLAVVRDLAADSPADYTVTMSKAKRVNRIYLDYLRNGRGATAIAPYSTRARPGAPVATPVRWDEVVPRLQPDRYTVGNLRRRLAALSEDPWAGFDAARVSLTPAIQAIVEG